MSDDQRVIDQDHGVVNFRGPERRPGTDWGMRPGIDMIEPPPDYDALRHLTRRAARLLRKVGEFRADVEIAWALKRDTSRDRTEAYMAEAEALALEIAGEDDG